MYTYKLNMYNYASASRLTKKLSIIELVKSLPNEDSKDIN